MTCLVGYSQRGVLKHRGSPSRRDLQNVCIGLFHYDWSIRFRSLLVFIQRCDVYVLMTGIFYCTVDAQGVGYRKLLWLTWNSQKIVLLVFFYALSNLLAYYALARVDASAYTVLLQVGKCNHCNRSMIYLFCSITYILCFSVFIVFLHSWRYWRQLVSQAAFWIGTSRRASGERWFCLL